MTIYDSHIIQVLLHLMDRKINPRKVKKNDQPYAISSDWKTRRQVIWCL